MNVPAAVLALVLLQAAAGSSVLLWLAPTWGAVRHGYEILTGGTIALLAWGAWGTLRGPVATLDDTRAGDGELALTLLAVTTIATGLAVVALVVKAPAVARVLGLAATAAAVAAFVPIAMVRTTGGGPGGTIQGVAELVLGSALLGAVWVGMILGHWYLVERRLTNRYMVWVAWANVIAVVAGFGSVLLSMRSNVPCVGLSGAELETCVRSYSPVLRIGQMTVWLGLGVLGLVATISAFNVKLAREGGRSIQAATGMFYLAVILAPTAELAAKVRYF